jgi:hypothetical protein
LAGSPQVEAGDDPHALVVRATLSEPGSLAVACARVDVPAEVHLVESPIAVEHTVTLYGLAEGSDYLCKLLPVCEDAVGADGTVLTVQATTLDSPDAVPSIAAIGEPEGPYFLLNHETTCTGIQPHRFFVFDAAGTLRWRFSDLPEDVSIGSAVQYLGEGRFLWGGGKSEHGFPRIIDVTGATLTEVTFEGSDALVFHHEARWLPGGLVLTLSESTNGNENWSWTGFQLHIVDPEAGQVVTHYDSQQAVDAGMLPAGGQDAYHANWADVDLERALAVVSLCASRWIVGIDLNSGEMIWRFGEGGDFDFQDPDGTPLSGDDWPQCQHGLALVGDRLLVYDNGKERAESRVFALDLDTESWTATRAWWWTEPAFFESAMGDVDEMDDGRVLVTRGHAECLDSSPGQVSAIFPLDPETGQVAWRLEFTDVADTVYRAERIDACDVFPNARWCPEVASRLSALGL